MADRSHPSWPRCRRHGCPLLSNWTCPACYWEDRARLLAEFDEIIDPIREELEANDV